MPRVVTLFAVGLALRLPALLFNGVADVFQMVLDWGFDVHALGLARGLDINYGVLSYAVFGVAADLGEAIPRFWWAPYKAAVILFDAAVLFGLLRVARLSDRALVTWLYWLNPWVILHGAYQGFWDGAYLLPGLVAVLALQRIAKSDTAWATAGVLLTCSAMFKLQGLLHLAGPLVVFLAVEHVRGRGRPLVAFLGGLGGTVLAVAAGLWLGGAGPLALCHNLASGLSTMPNLSNGGPNIWRFASFVVMQTTGQAGEVIDLRPGPLWVVVWSLVAGVACGAVLLAFSLRVSAMSPGDDDGSGWLASVRARLPQPSLVLPRATVALLLIALGSLVMSQFGVRAHINHTYGATVLLIPFVAADARLRPWWGALVVLQAVAEFSTYGLGSPTLIPPERALVPYEHAGALLASVKDLAAYREPDALLRAVMAINAWAGRLASPTVVSLLSLVVLGCTLGLLRSMMRRIGEGAPGEGWTGLLRG